MPPSGSHSRCDIRFVVSLIEMSCGPLTTERSSLAPASGSRSGCSTISVPAIAARTAPAAIFEAAGKDPDEAGDPSLRVDMHAGGDLRIVPRVVEKGLGEVSFERARRRLVRDRGTSSGTARPRPACLRARSSGFRSSSRSDLRRFSAYIRAGRGDQSQARDRVSGDPSDALNCQIGKRRRNRVERRASLIEFRSADRRALSPTRRASRL